ncbi:MAG: hypothetical protein U9O20_02710 [Patescibacteria group bacterium]|nr:hypothetical protein [Patescibacteria group bacterium]
MRIKNLIKKINLKDSAKSFFALVLIFGGLYVAINGFNYLDPINLCYVDIDEDVLRGNKRTIVEAIRKLKRDSKDEYRTMCRNTHKISENFCLASDWHLNPTWREDYRGKSCFIRGSKTIYLYPRKEYSQEIVEERAEAIKKYSNFSKEFWRNKK